MENINKRLSDLMTLVNYELMPNKQGSSFITVFYALKECFVYLSSFRKYFLLPQNICCAWGVLRT